MNKKIIWAIVIMGVIIFISIYSINRYQYYRETREIHLTHIGNVKINPPYDTYLRKTPFLTGCKGSKCKDLINSGLFPEIIFDDKSHRKFPDYSIEWPKDIHFKDNVAYYIGIGCTIEEMVYLVHKQVTRDGTSFLLDSVVLSPSDHWVITIYEGDVDAVST